LTRRGDDFGSLLHAPGGFLASAQSPVLNRLAALSDAKINRPFETMSAMA
jgi:hypothetical protein